MIASSSDGPPIRALVVPVTPLQQNCTIVWCARTMKAAVIDPGGEVPAPAGDPCGQIADAGEDLDHPTATLIMPAGRRR